jgi:SAM-dependent methyltransferase
LQEYSVKASCPLCGEDRVFVSPDDYWSCRDSQKSPDCSYGGCIPRHRGLAEALFSIVPRGTVKDLAVHEAAPGGYGVSAWLRQNCPGYVASGYFPDRPFGVTVGALRNEDLEQQTFPNGTFDIVIHLDVMEHIFDPFAALREIERTLKPDGLCLFTAPTDPQRAKSEQVAFKEAGRVNVVGEPEYHGNPQDPSGSLVTWRYGYDLPYLISKHTNFDIEVRRWHAPRRAIMGGRTETYILRRR